MGYTFEQPQRHCKILIIWPTIWQKIIKVYGLTGADDGMYFETRPIEVILADLAESWGRMQRIRNAVYAEVPVAIKVSTWQGATSSCRTM